MPFYGDYLDLIDEIVVCLAITVDVLRGLHSS